MHKEWWQVSRRQEELSETAKLCSEHFHSRHIDTTGQTLRLHEGAVPLAKLVSTPSRFLLSSEL